MTGFEESVKAYLVLSVLRDSMIVFSSSDTSALSGLEADSSSEGMVE